MLASGSPAQAAAAAEIAPKCWARSTRPCSVRPSGRGWRWMAGTSRAMFLPEKLGGDDQEGVAVGVGLPAGLEEERAEDLGDVDPAAALADPVHHVHQAFVGGGEALPVRSG